MWIICKYTIKSIFEKKLRTLLIILAISLAGALFIVSSELSNSIADMYEVQLKQGIGEVDLCISSDENSPSEYINDRLCQNLPEVARVVPVSYAYGEYKLKTNKHDLWHLVGYELEDYTAINQLKLIEPMKLTDFTGSKIIISQKTAGKYNLKVGDAIHLNILSVRRKFHIVAVAENVGIFASESSGACGLVPEKMLSKYNGGNGKPDKVYIKLQNEVQFQETTQHMKKIYPRYKVEEAIDTEAYKEQMSWIIGPFFLMTLIVVFISGFIIFSSFKVIMLEKLPAVGTFRSIGASKRTMSRVLLLESLGYGILGGALGIVLGYILLNIIAAGVLGDMSAIGQSKIQISTMICAYVFAVVVTLISTLIPIMGVSKISLKDIVLGNHQKMTASDLSKIILGIGLIIAGLLIAQLRDVRYGTITSISGMFMIIYGMISSLPMVINQLSKVMGKGFEVLFGNIGGLAAKNIKKNKSAINSITLITLGISVVMIISTVSENLSEQVIKAYSTIYVCQIEMNMPMMDLKMVKSLTSVSGIQNVSKTMTTEDIECDEVQNATINAFAIDDINFGRFMDFKLQGDDKALLGQLQEGRNIFISQILAKKYNLKVGDELHLHLEHGVRTYKIIGLMDIIWNAGFMTVVPMKYYKQDEDETYYDKAYAVVKPGIDENKVIERIKEKYEGETIEISSIESKTKEEEDSNANLMSMIGLFGVLTMVIGMVGVINNLLISFIERRKSFAVLRSIGMSQRQMLKMILIEALGNGVLGGVGGILGSMLLIYELNDVLFALNLPITVGYIPRLFVVYFIGGSLVTVLGSVLPACSTPKMNIIEAIKFE